MDYPNNTPRIFTAVRMDQANEYLRHRAIDGDTIRLCWPGVSISSQQACEGTAMALGLDITVEIAR